MSSCMNAGNIGIPNSVWNSSWNGLATQTGLEKATEKITGTVDKASQRITDAIAKIKTTANSEQPVPVTPGVKVFHDALKGISLAASRVADEVLGNPNEAKAAIESASSIAQQFSDLTVSAKQSAPATMLTPVGLQ